VSLIELLREEAPGVEEIGDAIEALVRARVKTDEQGARRALAKLSELLSRLAACADLAGRVAVRTLVRGPRPERFASFVAGEVLPAHIFADALEDLLARDPQAASSLERGAEEMRELYGGRRDPTTREMLYPHGFGLALSLDEEVTRRVKGVVANVLRGRVDPPRAAELVRDMGDWTRSYAENVVRTNVATAYSAGRFREARVLADEGVAMGFEFQTAGDTDVRRGRAQDNGENHRAMDGIRAREDDPVWQQFAPPLGYQCRCLLTPVVGGPWTRNALRTALARGARAAPGFGGRPDRRS
jgi:SPP1 gp7 family putative phage head morphogenesis protein